MTEIVSEPLSIPQNQEAVYSFLSDLKNLDKLQGMKATMPIKDLTYDSDSCRFTAEGVGTIALRIVEREPFTTIKFASTSSPVPFTCWIQLVGVDSNDTLIKVTIRADIPFLLKPIVAKSLEKGVKKVAEMLGALPY